MPKTKLLLSNKVNVGQAVLDSNSCFVFVNATFARYHGRVAAEYQGRQLDRLVPAGVWNIEAPFYKHVIEYKSTITGVEFRARCLTKAREALWKARYTATATGGVLALIVCTKPCEIGHGTRISASVLASAAISTLTRTELIVFNLLGMGKCTKEVASTLNISSLTVGTHRKRICQKLCVHSTAELICVATTYMKASSVTHSQELHVQDR